MDEGIAAVAACRSQVKDLMNQELNYDFDPEIIDTILRCLTLFGHCCWEQEDAPNFLNVMP